MYGCQPSIATGNDELVISIYILSYLLLNTQDQLFQSSFSRCNLYDLYSSDYVYSTFNFRCIPGVWPGPELFKNSSNNPHRTLAVCLNQSNQSICKVKKTRVAFIDNSFRSSSPPG